MSNSKKILSIINLKKYFPIAKSNLFQKNQLYVKANEDISIDILEGETFGLVGESGCGKSTLGRVILQLYNQTAGSTLYYGRTISEVAPSYVGYTLKNARKLIAKWKKAEEHAHKCVEECQALGEQANFYQLQNKNLAIADESTCLSNIVKVLGGFICIENVEEGAKILLERHTLNVDIAKLNATSRQLKTNEDIIQGKIDVNKDDVKLIASLKNKYSKLQAKLVGIENKLNKLQELRLKHKEQLIEYKKQFANNDQFVKYDAMLDDGIDLSRLKYNEMRQLRKDLQIIFQDPYSSLNPRMTVGQIIEEGLVTHNYFQHGSPSMKQYILDIMNECGLQDYMLHRYPHQFSGGQRQRICIARALAVKPKFIVCDECVSALDVSIQSQIINLLENLKEKEKLTYLFISHDLSVVRYISDRIGVMYLGNLVEVASAETIFNDPRHPYTVALLSSIPSIETKDRDKERIILEGSIPSPIKPPTGCKFHTRCYMACEKCKVAPPPFVEVEPGHFVACHFLNKKIDENGKYLFELPKMEKKYARQQDSIDAKNAAKGNLSNEMVEKPKKIKKRR